ncbi:MAG TPA: aminotransferase class III-fold pyridoxal phosphate-dependent enzyme, partial [Desulforhopalus sp.]|nr:aminotransferase class III-fold pyridoxal phosphate-dependent enzyme [Desulforhopalus sp.]
LRDLADLPGVGDVRGRGLFCGVEMVADKATREPLAESKMIQLAGEMAADGVLVGRTNRSLPGLNNTINLAPAYVVTREDIDIILSAMRKAINKVVA